MRCLDPGQALVALERRRPQHRDEGTEVLAHDDVGRERERGPVALAAREGRAVRLGEHREPDRERQEGRCDPCSARRASERDAREAHARSPPAGEQPPDEGEKPRGADGHREPDEARQEEEHERRRPALGELVRIHGATREDAERRDDGDHGGELGKAEASGATRLERDGEEDDERGAHGDGEPEQEAERGDHALGQDGGRGRTGGDRRHGSGKASDQPAERRAAEADGRALRSRQEVAVHSGRAVPREPAPGGSKIASQRAGRENGERDQERSRLAADEQ